MLRMCNKWYSLWADNYLAEFRISISLLVYGTIITSGSGDGHLNVFFSQRVCGFIPQEENHEQFQQSGNVVGLRSSRNSRWCTNHRQLAQRFRRPRLEEHQPRIVLAQCQLDTRHCSRWLRRRYRCS